jgi:two-component system response regulator NreC
MKTIRIMLVDDHDVVRAGLRAFLESRGGFEVVAEAGNGLEAIEKAAQFRPDLILLDITMPEMDGLEAARRLKAQDPACLILALTVHEDKQYFMKMLAAGASGYLTKQAAGEELVAAIHAVAQGHVYLQPALARWLLEDYQRLAKQLPGAPAQEPEQPREPSPDLDILSRRERQVLEMVGQGLTNQEMGTRLGLSPKTVARHRERIMSKLNLHSRTELVKFAIRSGLIGLG